jgi:PAS domain S-box-containing protein
MTLPGKRVAVLGLAFKPGTDDVRESPALTVIAALLKKGVATVIVHDPVAMDQVRTRPEFKNVLFAENWKDALQDSDACCVVTSWPEYMAIDPTEFAKRMRNPLVVDGRGMFDPMQFANRGVTWRGIGYTPEIFPAKAHSAKLLEDDHRHASRHEHVPQKSSPDDSLVAVIVRDHDGMIRYWSIEAELMYGWSPQEVLGTRTHQLFQTTFPAPLATIEKVTRNEKAWQGHLIHKRRDGSSVTVRSCWKIQENPKNKALTIVEINEAARHPLTEK